MILIYLLIAARGFKIALLADDGFSKLLATGLTAVFAIQAFVIIGGVTRVIPLTGVTLPFISYGGSSIVANFVLLALLLLISDRARREAAEPRGGLALGAREPPDRQALRLHRRPLRGPGRLHVLLVGLRRQGAEGKGRQQAAAARAAADPRGRILAADGTVIARSVAKGKGDALRYVRRYPEGALYGHPIGYSFVRQGDTEFEQFHNDELVGERIGIQLDPRRAARHATRKATTSSPTSTRKRSGWRWQTSKQPASAPWSRSSRAAAGSR